MPAQLTIYEKGLQFYYQQRINQGHHASHFDLGQLYESKQDLPNALKSYLNGAIQNIPNAQQALERLAGNNNVAQYFLGIVFENRQEWVKALAVYEKAASDNNLAAMYRIAEMYKVDRIENNATVIHKNISEFIKWHRKAAVIGSSHSLNALVVESASNPQVAITLAQMYEVGDGPFRNKEKVLEYYTKADVLNDKDAAFWLGQLFENGGHSVSQNIQTACQHYFKAAQRNHPQALMTLERMLSAQSDKQREYEFAELYQNIIKNSVAALKWYKKSAERGHSAALSRICEIGITNAEYAYTAAKIYEVFNNMASALNYHVMAACKEHQQAKIDLEKYANNGDSQALYLIGNQYYYQYKKNTLEGIKWCMKAGEKNHSQALHFITKTVFSADIYLKIAQWYEKGDGVACNINRAVEFYVKASDAGNKEATFRLGQLYENPSTGLVKNLQKSCQFYLKAIQQNHADALKAAEGVLHSLNDQQLEYELAYIYENVLKNMSNALIWYTKSAVKGHAKALSTLQRLAAQDPKFAYDIGKLYEPDIHTALKYYLMASQRENIDAQKRLEQLALTGNVDAQYCLGFDYYSQYKKNILEGVKWCMKAAEKNHLLAINYVTKTVFPADIYLKMAQWYELGDQVSVNMTRSLEFYIKASDAGDLNASYQLGFLEEQKPIKDLDKAIVYYAKAMQGGHILAKTSLERIARIPHKQACYLLSEFYKKSDMEQSLRYALCAAYLEHPQAKAYFETAQLTSPLAWLVAEAFDTGETAILIIPKNLPRAVRFYEQLEPKSPHYIKAHLRLMNIYESGEGGVGVNKTKVAHSSIKAATDPTQEQALEKAKTLVKELKVPDLSFELGAFFESLKQPRESLAHYKFAADKSHPRASAALSALAQADAALAFSTGQLYESDNSDQAIEYYRIALTKSNADCIAHVTKMANRGDAQAMYLLARYHYLPSNQMQLTIDFLMRSVALNHTDALTFFKNVDLNKSHYEKIASIYESGGGIYKQNFQLAIVFRVKALNITEPQKLMHIAGLCESDTTDPVRGKLMAWEYYMKAAQLGSADPLRALARLAEFGSAQQQQELSAFYNGRGNDPKKAQYWIQKATSSASTHMLLPDLTVKRLKNGANNVTPNTFVPTNINMNNVNNTTTYNLGL